MSRYAGVTIPLRNGSMCRELLRACSIDRGLPVNGVPQGMKREAG